MRLLTLSNRFSVSEGTIHDVAYPRRSFLSYRGYDSGRCLPSQIVFRFPRVRFRTLLTLSNRFSVSEGTIHDVAYPRRSFLSYRGYDSGRCLPSQIVFRFPRLRFRTLLTLPDRFSVSEGTICHVAYPTKSFFGFRGYESGRCLPSQIVSRFPRVRVKTLLTLPDRFSVSEGTIRHVAYTLKSFFGFRGYDSSRCLPSQIVSRFPRVRLPCPHLITIPQTKKTAAHWTAAHIVYLD
ncbi:hypothetical protein RKD52_001726 [Metabacillus sp. SLBN-84]